MVLFAVIDKFVLISMKYKVPIIYVYYRKHYMVTLCLWLSEPNKTGRTRLVRLGLWPTSFIIGLCFTPMVRIPKNYLSVNNQNINQKIGTRALVRSGRITRKAVEGLCRKKRPNDRRPALSPLNCALFVFGL